ncbi:MAG TPA: guanylate kinase [Gammaproteobacteria bacterium]|nr:guanylate kinase [Gammaproteobacteria bacterium]HAR91243.1 guanylate kinase [Gammaproteobacteria bacterium]HAU23274.1 guanylate kinase [Gammaproteobacteria bacterium]HBJ90992.1 guanylate kinase [Gammaproteobacteria bacterium]HBP99595.1 guanylate kinase [Gammaproteobacteria bacterium]|tara:strand:- start:1009 stop:1626 length:618 start_codon:yes stop_codon:yes gene_type:complete
MAKGKLIIVSAPSGAGKTSLVAALVTDDDSLCVSVSHTTRPKRPKEEDGVNYHFTDEQTFLNMLQDGDFLESAEVYGHHYGTSQKWVNEQLEKGQDVVLEIDWQGAAQVRNLYPESCYIFILPPSLETLTERLRHRAQDDEAIIAKRMEEARTVLQHVCEADYMVVNDEFDTALADIRAILRAQGLTVTAQQFNLAELLTSLTRD